MAARHSIGIFRAPRTTNERRNYELIVEDEYNDAPLTVRIKIRGKRLPNSLPNSWDDTARGRRGRTWKSNGHKRAKQWM